MNTLLDKLNGLVARFEEVSTLITDPNVIADQQRYVRLTKEYKELEDLMAARCLRKANPGVRREHKVNACAQRP